MFNLPRLNQETNENMKIQIKSAEIESVVQKLPTTTKKSQDQMNSQANTEANSEN